MSALWAIVWGAFWAVETVVEVVTAHPRPVEPTVIDPPAYIEVWPNCEPCTLE